MPDFQLRPADFNCEILPCETHPDFDDSTRFKKVEFPEQAGLAANSLLQLIPTQAAADAVSNTYVLRFPKGIHGALMNLNQGGQSTTMVDATGHFAGTASLYKVDPASVAASQMFSVASFATGQYFLADISSKLTEVNRKLDDLLVFLQASKRTELLSELTFVKYALTNYSTIMLSEPQRMAPSAICNVQKSRPWLTWNSTQSNWRILLAQKPTKIKPEPYCKTSRASTLLLSFTQSAPLWKLTMRKIGTNLTLQISKPM